MPRKNIIIGAGPVGSLTGIYLAERGHNVEIYERRPDPRSQRESEGRSINLALSRRGFDALEPVGIKGDIMALATPMKGRMIHPVEGPLAFQHYGKDESEVIFAVSRGELNRKLVEVAAEKPRINITFDKRCIDVEPRGCSVTLRDEVTGEVTERQADVIFGADGANSVVRHAISRLPRISISQQYIEYGYKELTIPSGNTGEYLIDNNALHIWPRGGYMLIALPNIDGSFTCTLFFPFEGEESFESLNTEPEIEDFFKRVFPDAARLIPDLVRQYLANPTSALATIRISPWNVSDKVMLIGDAAHGIVPFLGQGLNCALESVVELMGFLDYSSDDWENAFRQFGITRKPDTDAIADLALDNFIEMRDRVADPKFLLKKNVEVLLERRFFPRFIARYAMIQFHRVPYLRAKVTGLINEQILRELCVGITSAEQLDWVLAGKLIERFLPSPTIPETIK